METCRVLFFFQQFRFDERIDPGVQFIRDKHLHLLGGDGDKTVNKKYPLAKYLKEKREKVGLSQNRAAKLIGLSGQFVSNWERGESAPPRRAYKKLVKAYGIDKEELIALKLAHYEAELREVLE
jgi:ribosome-binding protein aMBF1 (putative translation factor)